MEKEWNVDEKYLVENLISFIKDRGNVKFDVFFYDVSLKEKNHGLDKRDQVILSV